MKKIINLGAVVTIVFLALISPNNIKNADAAVDAEFDPSYIISDEELLDAESMSLPDIQHFLQSKNSYLANYIAPNSNGMMKTAAEIIYDATNRNFDCSGVKLTEDPTEAEKRLKCKTIKTVSPKFMLILLQKEASLVEDTKPSEGRLNWATGYGCPDNWTCNPYYKGFGKQVNSAALQFLAYMKEPYNYNYRKGETYTFSNPYGTISNEEMIVIPRNQATAALYNYTPHVFNGNYNVYKLFKRYFPESEEIIEEKLDLIYPDGSLLKVEGSPGIYLIDNQRRRPFVNYSSFISRFSPEQIITTTQDVIDAYPQGANIKFPNYSIVQTPNETIYLLAGKEKRPFASFEVYKTIGFHPDEIESATQFELAEYIIGSEINTRSTYVTGALLQDVSSGGVYYVENGVKAPLLDKAFLETRFKDKSVTRVSPEILEKYPKIDPVLFLDGTLLKSKNTPTVYLISNGKKRPFANGEIFKSLGYKDQNIITVSSQLLYHYPLGEPIK